MEFQWQDFSSDVTSAVQKAIVLDSPIFDFSQNIANTLYGLGVMGAQWSDLATDAQRALSVSFVKFNPKLTEQGVANSVYGLGLMGCQLQQLSNDFRIAVEAALQRLAPTMSDQAVSNTVYGFGKMGATRSTLFFQAAKSLVASCVRCFPTMTSQGVSNVLYGYYLMGMEWNRTSPEFQNSVFTALVRVFSGSDFNDQALANTLLALASMGVSWSCFPSQVHSAFCNALSTQSHTLTAQVSC
jgi:hypothetical protein